MAVESSLGKGKTRAVTEMKGAEVLADYVLLCRARLKELQVTGEVETGALDPPSLGVVSRRHS